MLSTTTLNYHSVVEKMYTGNKMSAQLPWTSNMVDRVPEL